MKKARRARVFSYVLLALALFGCMAAVDDDGGGSSSDPASVVSENHEALTAAPLEATIDRTEIAPVVDGVDLSIDPAETELAASTCTRVCACCRRNGNRFCCSHCRFCSGPIGPYGVTDEVLAP